MEKTEGEVKSAYKMARRLAKHVMSKITPVNNSSSMGYEDFVQEGMLAWLEGKSMYYGMIDAFREQAMLGKYSYTTKGMTDPQVVPFNEEVDGHTDDESEEVIKHIDAQKVMQRILAVENEQVQFALLGYLCYGMSLRDLGEVLEMSHEGVRLYLINPELKKIREEFSC
jgi:hypothetical protein